MNINLLSLPLPSFEDILRQCPGYFDEAIDPKEAAHLMSTSTGALAQMRCRNIGPKFSRLGEKGRVIRYTRRHVFEYLRKNLHVPITASQH